MLPFFPPPTPILRTLNSKDQGKAEKKEGIFLLLAIWKHSAVN